VSRRFWSRGPHCVVFFFFGRGAHLCVCLAARVVHSLLTMADGGGKVSPQLAEFIQQEQAKAQVRVGASG